MSSERLSHGIHRRHGPSLGLAVLLLAALGSCAEVAADNPSMCSPEGLCPQGRVCYRQYCVLESERRGDEGSTPPGSDGTGEMIADVEDAEPGGDRAAEQRPQDAGASGRETANHYGDGAASSHGDAAASSESNANGVHADAGGRSTPAAGDASLPTRSAEDAPGSASTSATDTDPPRPGTAVEVDSGAADARSAMSAPMSGSSSGKPAVDAPTPPPSNERECSRSDAATCPAECGDRPECRSGRTPEERPSGGNGAEGNGDGAQGNGNGRPEGEQQPAANDNRNDNGKVEGNDMPTGNRADGGDGLKVDLGIIEVEIGLPL